MVMIAHLSSLELDKTTPPQNLMSNTCDPDVTFSRARELSSSNYDIVALFELPQLEHGTSCILQQWKRKFVILTIQNLSSV